MVTESTSGTLTADGTEQTVIADTDDKFFGGYIDLTNMASGDTVVLKRYVTIASGGTYKLFDSETFTNAQTNVLIEFPLSPSIYGYKVTLQQTGGTNRTYLYEFFEV